MNKGVKIAFASLIAIGVGTLIYYKFLKHQLTKESLSENIVVEIDENI